ncbi:E4.3 [Deer atadenovirus A]|nr:E4.3 [Deer atadenovirus A]UWT50610.1 E4.3 [Deer atadenovirus A]
MSLLGICKTFASSTVYCEDGHYLFYMDIPFLSLEVVRQQCSHSIEFKLMSIYLCALPCQRGRVHCHCPCPSSLQCLSLKQLLKVKLLCLKRTIPVSLPWTNCCSNIIFYKVKEECVFIARYWNAIPVEEEIVKYCAYRRLNFGHLSVIFLLKNVDNEKLRKLLNVLHVKMNIPDCKGFHFPPYDYDYWKSGETAGFHSQPCMLRFITFRGQEYQERYLKRCFFKHLQSKQKELL